MIVFIILIFVFENKFEMLLDQLIHRKQLQQAQFKIKVKYPKYKLLQEVMIVGKREIFIENGERYRSAQFPRKSNHIFAGC